MCTCNNPVDEMVSIVIPLYNEEKYIGRLMKSISKQSYDHRLLELVLIDGGSTDKTLEKINQSMCNIDFACKILSNPKKETVISLNMGIKEAIGSIIVRLDGHCEIDEDYIEKLVCCLNEMGAQNVGGVIQNVTGNELVTNSIANVLSSPFGVGNSKFRISSKSGYVDTVPYGCFRKELFDNIGYFKEGLIRSEDNEFNARIIKNGGKIYLCSDVVIKYYVRKDVGQLLRMGFLNGKDIPSTFFKYPGSIKIRHMIPFAFFMFIILGTILSFLFPICKTLFLVGLGIYLIAQCVATIKNYPKYKSLLISIYEFLIYPAFHISYGFGSFVGLFKRN